MNIVGVKGPSVRFDTIAPAGFRILSAIDQAAQHCRVDLIITSGTDSHRSPDPHAEGAAYDVSVQGLSAPQIADVYASLQTTLGPLFTVLYEVPTAPSSPLLRHIAYVNAAATGAHFHIQRKRDTTFPPTSRPTASTLA